MADSVVIGCRIIAEFDDDAAACTAGGSVPGSAENVSPSQPRNSDAGDSFLDFLPAPSRQAAAAKKKLWLRAIRRLMEPVPGARNRFRIRSADEPTRARLIIESSILSGDSVSEAHSRRFFSGYEIDVSDGFFLLLIDQERPLDESGSFERVREVSSLIQWTEIVHISSEAFQLPHGGAQAAAG